MTTGDILHGRSPGNDRNKGLFVKELEQALLENKADLAVHSMKDVPVTLPPGLTISAVLERENPADAFVSSRFAGIDDLPPNAVVGTSSLRRCCQLLHRSPSLTIKPLHGNIETRLRRLDDGEHDALILACAGLKRLRLQVRIRQTLPLDISLPAIGQGIIGIECREKDTELRKLLAALNHQTTRKCLSAERAVNERLGGDCRLPIAAYAVSTEDQLHLKALVGSPDGKTIIRAETRSRLDAAQTAGIEAAEKLLQQGAQKILDACRSD